MLTNKGQKTIYDRPYATSDEEENTTESDIGYIYYKNKVGKKVTTCNCQFQRHGCKASITVSNADHEILKRRHEHMNDECVVTHNGYINKQAMNQVKLHIRKAKIRKKVDVHDVVYSTMSQTMKSDTVTTSEYTEAKAYQDLRTYNSVRSTLLKGAKSDIPNPQNVLELLTQLNESSPLYLDKLKIEVHANKKEMFTLCKALILKDDVCIMFGTAKMLKELFAQKMICCDGTFKVVPDVLYCKKRAIKAKKGGTATTNKRYVRSYNKFSFNVSYL